MRVTTSTLLLLLCLFACDAPKRELYLVQVAGLHLFEEPGKRLGKDARQHQENLNREAFSALLEAMRRPGLDVEPQFLVLTGDFGIDPTWTTGSEQRGGDNGPVQGRGTTTEEGGQKHRRAGQVNLLASLFRASPVKDIYLVPGNNDMRDELASDEELDYAIRFFEDVQKKLEGSGVVLHNLVACYFGENAPLSGCYADVPGTSFRLVGFPSYSFKNRTEKNYKDNRERQERQVEKFRSLITRAEAQSKKVLVLSHTAEVDDPYTLARERFLRIEPDPHGNQRRPRWSSWNVSARVFEQWKDIIDSDAVVGVMAGHFHDSHKEFYYPPYSWSTTSLDRPDPNKLFLAPPLAVKLQDASPIQARGFSLIRLSDDELTRWLYWYDAASRTFTADPLSWTTEYSKRS